MSEVVPVLAQAAPAPQQGGGAGFFIAQMMPLILIFVIMYLLLIRPQQKKANEHREMVNRLKVGDRIVTSGGMYGTVTGVDDKSVRIKVAENVEVRMIRSSVGAVLGEGEV
ncbi:MAG: preprotein translocase subunit YajC [Lentisphaerae bacterium RIFOXYB12_FULL_65_16]|nr:MAG: preprotein translocase subunit YajC [Lentisphaerae bacterium RIFOXYA12_64_32]OGV92829.1 MAG: preprotein translocase subunit YajC [Lentisphaerae bacterium RIFOXYB12_FULL_65_16]